MQPLSFTSGNVFIQAAAQGDPAKFSVLAYTGGPLNLYGWQSPVVVDLEGLKPGKSVIANLDHDSSKRVGHVPSSGIENDGRTLRLSGYLSASTPHRDEVLASARSGFVWQASIEADPLQLRDIDRGQTVNVNGRNFAGPLILVAVGILKGFAFVSHGADDDTSVSIAASRRYYRPGFEPQPNVSAYFATRRDISSHISRR
jgi:hypothetical protein